MQVLMRIVMLMVLSCLSALAVFSQVERKHFKIKYVINIADIDTTFVDNDEHIKELKDFLHTIRDDRHIRLNAVRFSGTASPDGSYEFNQWLSVNRLENFKKLIRTELNVPDSIIFANDSYIAWEGFRQKVAESDLPYREEILAVIDEGPKLVRWFGNRHIDHRLLKLRSMHRGKVWESLKKPILFDLRFADAEFEFSRYLNPIFPERLHTEGTLPPPVPLPTFDIEPPLPKTWVRRLHLKTNFVDLGLLIANLAVEADLAPHWSFTLPLYYSALDYFKSTVKFRVLGCQPELRYWPRQTDNDGFFIGAHIGASYYNFAFDGDYRNQDHDGTTPTIGGGISLGYRRLLGKSQRWRMEFSAGAGIYPLDYDLFHNTPFVTDGMLAGRCKKTYIGLDQAAVTLAYSFDIQHMFKWAKKGGSK